MACWFHTKGNFFCVSFFGRFSLSLILSKSFDLLAMEDHPHDESFDLQEIHRFLSLLSLSLLVHSLIFFAILSRVKELEYVHRNCIDESGESIPCGFEALAQDYALQLEVTASLKTLLDLFLH